MSKKCFTLISFVLVLGLVSNASAELVGQWKLDDGAGTAALDATGNGHDGELIGNPQWVVGYFGGGLEFSGATDKVDIPQSADLNPENEFTVSVWANVDPAGAGHRSPVTSRDDYPQRGYIIYCEPGNTWQFWTGSAAGGWNNAAGPAVALGEWTHVAATYSSGEKKLYINGELGAESTDTMALNTAQVLRIGAGATEGDGNYFFQGTIDDVRVYNHVLTQADIKSSMENQGGAIVKAYGPDPRDGAMLEATWVTLTWRAGDLAVSRDVYMGDNFDDVNNGTADTFQGNQASTMLIAGFAGFAYPDGLVPGTTYYWRIDEVNDTDPNSPWKGDVWSFSIPPKTAYNPDPADGAEFVDPNADLTWTPGFGGKLHTVYMGTNFDDVNNASAGTPLGSASYSPAALESEKIYYWRVDEFDPPFTHKGDIWSFTTPGAVGNPQPANGAVDVPMNATLSWTAADNAASHELYFGTDADAVKNATTASAEYAGPRALGSESYDPDKLDWDTAYHWRVDEVYPGNTVKGLLWSFTTADFISVDDFESYNDIDPPDSANNRIFDKWIDGFGTTTNGALVGNDLPPYAEQSIVHGGAQALVYRYDNNLKTSEATFTLVHPRDWTEDGVTRVVLWYRGASANAAERMFVALNGTAVVYHDDPSVTQVSKWTAWVIDLQAFADQGANLANVNTITIGFGTKGSPAAGGTGTMYFDDIRLYRPTE